jgi:hypothetical protein
MKLLFTSLASLFILAACAPFSPDSSHAGMCNELNSQIIFSGSTSNIRNAEMDAAEEPMLQRSYDTKCDNVPKRKNTLFNH